MPGRKPEPEKDSSDDWLGTYGDMVTLLLCFFVLLAGSSEVDVVMFEQMSAGLAKGIGNRDVKMPIEGLRMDLDSEINSMQLGDAIGLGADAHGLIIEFATGSFYAKGNAEIKKETKPVFLRIAGTLMAERYNSFEVEIQGHTDDDEANISALYDSAWDLSAARATNLVEMFVDSGIAKTRMKAVGMADIAPKFPNKDAYGEKILENQQKNRRIVIRITPRPKL